MSCPKPATVCRMGAWMVGLCLGGAISPMAMAAPGTVIFAHVDVVPMDDEHVLRDRNVVVNDGIITAISAAVGRTPSDALVIDATGRYLMPGLAEMHAHVPSIRQGAPYIEDVLFLYLANGITTIRGMLGEPHHLELRARLAAHEIVGPRLFTSGPSFNGNSVRGPAEAVAKANEQAETGYDFLKLHPGLSRASFDAVVTTAGELGIPFAGHVSLGVGLAPTLEAGQATIDHLDAYLRALVDREEFSQSEVGFFGLPLTPLARVELIPPLAAATARAGVWNVPTQSLIEHIVLPDDPDVLAARPEMRYMPPSMIDTWRDRKRGMLGSAGYDPRVARRFVALRRQLIKALHDSGAGLLLGSDAPQIFQVPGFSIHYELEMLVAAGLTPYQALRTGTLNPAVFFARAKHFGSVAEGLEADLILLSKNPLEDPGALRRPEGVMSRGRWFDRAALDAGLERIAAKHAQ